MDVSDIPQAEVLGPVSAVTKAGKKTRKLLIKAQTHKELLKAVQRVLKGLKGKDVTVDIDPLEL